MNDIQSMFEKTKELHHAYCVVGHFSFSIPRVISFLENSVNFKVHGNPDFWHGKYDTLTIDEARKISSAQENKSFQDGKKVFIIEANTITIEAQNSLLKVFEEPTAQTHFFICIPQDTLLPTLRSRVQIISEEGYEQEGTSILSKNIVERLSDIKKMTDDISDEEKTKQDAITLLNCVEQELYKNGVEKNAHALSLCESARVALYDRGAPIKMILEHVMLAL